MRLREEEKLSPEAERDLAVIDAALAGDPVPEDEALAGFVRDLRAERPTPEPRFEAEVDARAAEGFRGAGPTGPVARLRERLAATPPRRMLAPAGALATLAVVAGVAISQTGGGDDSTSLTIEPAGGPDAAVQEAPGAAAQGDEAPTPGDAGSIEIQPAPEGAAEPGAADDTILAPAHPGRSGLAPGQDDRKVERAAQITLSTEPEDVPDVADDVIGVSDSYGGIVVSSNVSESPEGRSVARIELAIPSKDLPDALSDLSELADVSSRSESTLDVTQPFVSARERLADARAELDALLIQLAEADTPRETRSIRARMDIVREEIAAARSELESIARRARFAQVSVTVEGDGGSDEDAWSLGDAADDALDVLRTVAGIGLVSLAVLLPVALLGLVGWLVARGAARRRRERALD